MAEARRVLLLGATGFLGRHAQIALEAASHTVLGVAGPTSAASTWSRGDLLTVDVAALIRAAAPDAIVNATGRTSGSPAALEGANVTLVRRLLDAASTLDVRLVHLGSSAEYGPGTPGRPTSEDDPAEPVAAYGETKLRATELVRSSGLDATVLRVFNPVGDGMARESMPGRAAHLIADALDRGAESIELGPLSARRDFVDARDVAEAVVAATRASGGPAVINIGSGRAVVARELVTMLADVAGFGGTIVEQTSASPRSGGVDYQCADVRLARSALGWEATHTLRDAVSALWSGASG